MFNIHFSIERWKWNADFGIYVSTKGRFRNESKKDIPITVDNKGYCRVYCGGTTHTHLLAHRVVLLTWRPTANAGNLTVDHLDHNKRNNALDNLEWVSFEENQRRAKADEIAITVQGDAELVEKVSVSVTLPELPKTKYSYVLVLRGGVRLTIEQAARLFYDTHSKSFPFPGKVVTEWEFANAIYNVTKNNQHKLFGYIIEKKEKV